MREIKFRAWITDNDLFETDKKVPYMEHNFAFQEYMMVNDELKQMQVNGFPLMQYTHSKDSEGTKIFEMDVLENEEGKRFLVKWGINSSGFIAKTEESHGNVYSLYHLARKTKVIGNIYENPELIKNV